MISICNSIIIKLKKTIKDVNSLTLLKKDYNLFFLFIFFISEMKEDGEIEASILRENH